eukprot:7039599-Ditylum_brightwellii.AAC.1
MNISKSPNGNLNTATTNLLTQFASPSLDDLKHHANWYFSGDENLNDVPDKAAMIIANTDPTNDAVHKRCYPRCVCSSMMTNNIQGWIGTESFRYLEP